MTVLREKYGEREGEKKNVFFLGGEAKIQTVENGGMGGEWDEGVHDTGQIHHEVNVALQACKQF